MSRFGQPVTGTVKRQDGERCPRSMPSYLVRPISTQGHGIEVKILDLGNGMFESVNIVDQN